MYIIQSLTDNLKHKNTWKLQGSLAESRQSEWCNLIVIENQLLTDNLEKGRLESYGILIWEQTIRMITCNPKFPNVRMLSRRKLLANTGREPEGLKATAFSFESRQLEWLHHVTRMLSRSKPPTDTDREPRILDRYSFLIGWEQTIGMITCSPIVVEEANHWQRTSTTGAPCVEAAMAIDSSIDWEPPTIGDSTWSIFMDVHLPKD